ncbi:hypothetical protein HDU98_000382 [Podochytrium sp. JEL0797]|nr:hypothetical protein HDU98_000382 [Podochytrium sp. JEL0797]
MPPPPPLAPPPTQPTPFTPSAASEFTLPNLSHPTSVAVLTATAAAAFLLLLAAITLFCLHRRNKARKREATMRSLHMAEKLHEAQVQGNALQVPNGREDGATGPVQQRRRVRFMDSESESDEEQGSSAPPSYVSKRGVVEGAVVGKGGPFGAASATMGRGVGNQGKRGSKDGGGSEASFETWDSEVVDKYYESSLYSESEV